jgi:23S rRNA (uridine2479-2'-O)-methyltransferase
MRVRSRDARFQQWQALLTNRTKRHRAGEFLVQGVRPITLAFRHGWTIRALLHDEQRPPSRWAAGLMKDAETSGATVVAMHPELLSELGEKDEGVPELLAIVAQAPDDLNRLPVAGGDDRPFLGLVMDRPASPGNLGTVVRSADALGASGVIVTGHAADVYDPKAVRASTGSLFSVPVVRVSSSADVHRWLAEAHDRGIGVETVALDEKGAVDIAAHDLTGPTLLLVGNEKSGLSAAWRDLCTRTVRIPIGGGASSLNAALSATVALYEAARQRARPGDR